MIFLTRSGTIKYTKVEIVGFEALDNQIKQCTWKPDKVNLTEGIHFKYTRFIPLKH